MATDATGAVMNGGQMMPPKCQGFALIVNHLTGIDPKPTEKPNERRITSERS
jgi:hypothetical protein